MEVKKTSALAINNEAIVKIAGIAALEVEGVAGLARRPIKFRNFKRLMNGARNSHSKSVGLSNDNGAIALDVFITVFSAAKVNEVAEAVQSNVKDKVQGMTGSRIDKVNVFVDDLVIEDVQ